MSAVTVFARGNRAVLLSDTAGYDPDVIVRAWVNKVATLPHLRTAMVGQGAAEALSTLSDRLACELQTFDSMIEHGEAFLAAEHDLHMMRWADGGNPDFRLCIVGWSTSRKRFEAHYIHSIDSLGIPPFTFVQKELILAPMLAASDLEALGVPTDGGAFAADAQTHLLRILKLQRRVPAPVHNFEGVSEGYSIGGEVIATELTLEGITQRVIHRWPDKLDEPIRPEPMPADLVRPQAASVPGGLNRRARRELEAQQARQRKALSRAS